MKELIIQSRDVGKGLVLVTVSGDLVADSIERLREATSPIFAKKKVEYIILDLQAVEHFSSAAASLLFEYNQLSASSGRKFGILSPSGPVRAVLELLGGDDFFLIRDSIGKMAWAMGIDPSDSHEEQENGQGEEQH